MLWRHPILQRIWTPCLNLRPLPLVLAKQEASLISITRPPALLLANPLLFHLLFFYLWVTYVLSSILVTKGFIQTDYFPPYGRYVEARMLAMQFPHVELPRSFCIPLSFSSLFFMAQVCTPPLPPPLGTGKKNHKINHKAVVAGWGGRWILVRRKRCPESVGWRAPMKMCIFPSVILHTAKHKTPAAGKVPYRQDGGSGNTQSAAFGKLFGLCVHVLLPSLRSPFLFAWQICNM